MIQRYGNRGTKNEQASRLESENLQVYGHKYTDISKYGERERNVAAQTQKYGFIRYTDAAAWMQINTDVRVSVCKGNRVETYRDVRLRVGAEVQVISLSL